MTTFCFGVYIVDYSMDRYIEKLLKISHKTRFTSLVSVFALGRKAIRNVDNKFVDCGSSENEEIKMCRKREQKRDCNAVGG
jgi:hypothetical protein